MPHNPHHRCTDCGILLSRNYPWELCPKHWKQKYHAPPGESRIDHFEAAVKLARDPPLYTTYTNNPIPGSAIAATV